MCTWHTQVITKKYQVLALAAGASPAYKRQAISLIKQLILLSAELHGGTGLLPIQGTRGRSGRRIHRGSPLKCQKLSLCRLRAQARNPSPAWEDRQTDREGNATEADVAAHAECERWGATYISPYNDLVANLPIANCQTFQSRAWATKPA